MYKKCATSRMTRLGKITHHVLLSFHGRRFPSIFPYMLRNFIRSSNHKPESIQSILMRLPTDQPTHPSSQTLKLEKLQPLFWALLSYIVGGVFDPAYWRLGFVVCKVVLWEGAVGMMLDDSFPSSCRLDLRLIQASFCLRFVLDHLFRWRMHGAWLP